MHRPVNLMEKGLLSSQSFIITIDSTWLNKLRTSHHTQKLITLVTNCKVNYH
jgi:hypothetical protein